MLRIAISALVLATVPLAFAASSGPVLLHDEGAKVRLSNGTISLTINKADATIRTMTLANSPNLAGRGAYLAVANSTGRDGWDVHSAGYQVVRNTPELAELSFGAQIGGVHFTQYYVLRRGDRGFYVFLLEQRRPGDPPEHTGQVRWSFYLNDALFNYHLASDTEQGPVPDLRGARQIQDATFRLTNGTVYTKYNYCVYLENDRVHGLCGIGRGSYGAFIITPSAEYLQAPTKQEITVHAGPIMHRFLASGHFLSRELSSPSIPDGWTKLCGPWMVYLNTGDSPQQIWSDAKIQAEKEQVQWPYGWMSNPEYPLRRAEVIGTLKLYDGKQSASNALMVLTGPEPDWQVQVLNYIFSARADATGHFALSHVRPGNYTLFAAVPGVTDEFRKDHVTVSVGQTLDLGTLVFAPAYYSARLWQIGLADRTTTGFRLSDKSRQYGLEDDVPSNLIYKVGSSLPSRDWYYAQAWPGDWRIDFDVDRSYQGEGVLTIGIAGQTRAPRLQVLVNHTLVGSYAGGNSGALYRSAVLGSSYHENKVIRFPASLLRQGNNAVTLRLSHGSIMYDVVKLEVDDPTLPKSIPMAKN